MQTTGLEITRFMLDDTFWKTASTSDESYLVNGEPFNGNILLVKPGDAVEIRGGIVDISIDDEVPLTQFFSAWRNQVKYDVIGVLCEKDRRTELVELLKHHGFAVMENPV